jgi:hypothetical protein
MDALSQLSYTPVTKQKQSADGLADLKHLNESPAEIPLRYFRDVQAILYLEFRILLFLWSFLIQFPSVLVAANGNLPLEWHPYA